MVNDLFSQVKITNEMVPNLVNLIRLHTDSTDNEVTVEPIKLLRTILYKVPEGLYFESIYGLFESLRA